MYTRLKVIIFSAIIVLVIDLNGQTSTSNSTKGVIIEEPRHPNKELYHFKIISSTNNTWGYDILKDNKLFIHQTNIPCMAGNDGFKRKSDSEKVAKLVIGKLEKGEIPPSVTQEELKELNILLTK